MSNELILLLLLSGAIGGFLAGLIGIGGGIIYVFVLNEFLPDFGVLDAELTQFIIANSFFAILFASLSASITLIRKKEFYYRQTLAVGLPAIIVAILVQQLFVNTRYYSKAHYSVVIIAILIFMFIKTLLKTRSKADKDINEISQFKFSLSGMSGAVIAALSGLGGGAIMVPILNSIYKLDYKIARSISLGVVTIISFTFTIFNIFSNVQSSPRGVSSGYIIFDLSILLVLGVVVTSPLGILAGRKMKSNHIAYIYAVFLTVFIIKEILELIN